MYHGATEIRAAQIGRFISETDKWKKTTSWTTIVRLSSGTYELGLCRMHGVAVEAVN